MKNYIYQFKKVLLKICRLRMRRKAAAPRRLRRRRWTTSRQRHRPRHHRPRHHRPKNSAMTHPRRRPVRSSGDRRCRPRGRRGRRGPVLRGTTCTSRHSQRPHRRHSQRPHRRPRRRQRRRSANGIARLEARRWIPLGGRCRARSEGRQAAPLIRLKVHTPP